MSQPLKKATDPTLAAATEPEEGYVSKVDRRTALAWVGVVGAALAGGAGVVIYGERPRGSALPKGYGTDPNLAKPAKARDSRETFEDLFPLLVLLRACVDCESGSAGSVAPQANSRATGAGRHTDSVSAQPRLAVIWTVGRL